MPLLRARGTRPARTLFRPRTRAPAVLRYADTQGSRTRPGEAAVRCCGARVAGDRVRRASPRTCEADRTVPSLFESSLTRRGAHVGRKEICYCEPDYIYSFSSALSSFARVRGLQRSFAMPIPRARGLALLSHTTRLVLLRANGDFDATSSCLQSEVGSRAG